MIIPKYVHIEENLKEIRLTSDLDGTQIILQGPKTLADFRQLQAGQEIDNPELIGKLKMTGMYVNVESFTSIADRFRDSLSRQLRLTIMPTLNCNFRCVYCYEDHHSNMMSTSTLDGVVKYIEDNLDNWATVNVNWFGGEPLLASDLIIEYSAKMRNIAESAGKKYRSAMTTNGYLLDIENFKKLYKAGVPNFQITLDGFEHDKKRILADGSPTLDVILNNLCAIHALDSEEYKFEILLRRNILPNESTEWYKFLYDKLGNDSRFKFIIRKVFSSQRMNVGKLQDELEAEHRKHEEECNKYFRTFDSVPKVRLGESICYAAMPNGFVILPDGSIQKCTTTNFTEDWQKVGKVTAEGFEIDTDKNKVWTYAPITEKCLTCKKLLSCLNMMCPKQRMDPSYHSACCCDK